MEGTTDYTRLTVGQGFVEVQEPDQQITDTRSRRLRSAAADTDLGMPGKKAVGFCPVVPARKHLPGSVSHFATLLTGVAFLRLC
jgi:hypothetical protein